MYKRIKDGNSKRRETCKFLEELAKILVHCPTTVPLALLHSLADCGESSATCNDKQATETSDEVDGK